MLRIPYPPHQFRLKEKDGKEYIFDEIRKKWLRLSPEEWVRQNTVQYLIQVAGYPASLIGIEKELMLNDVKKRCDILIYKHNLPLMMIECKEMQVPLTEAVLKQVLTYNMALPVQYLCVTNGSYCYAWQRQNNTLAVLKEFPLWKNL